MWNIPSDLKDQHTTIQGISLNDLGRYGFNKAIYELINHTIKKVTPDIIFTGQTKSLFSVYASLLLCRKYTVNIIHTADTFCHNSMLTKLETKAKCQGGFGHQCIKHKCEPTSRFLLKTIVKKVNNTMLRMVFNSFVCHSIFMKEKLNRFFSRNVFYVPLTFKKNIQVPVEKSSNGQVKFLFIGALEWHKGIQELISGFQLFAANDEMKGQLEVVGKGSLLGEIQNQVAHNQTSQIKLLGHLDRPNMMKKISESDVIIFPSYFETFGLVAYEAMLFGKTLITTDRGALPEVTNNYKKKIILKEISSSEIKLALEKSSQYLYEKFDEQEEQTYETEEKIKLMIGRIMSSIT